MVAALRVMLVGTRSLYLFILRRFILRLFTRP